MNLINQLEVLDINQYEEKFTGLLNKFTNATTFTEQDEYFILLNRHRLSYRASENEAKINYYSDTSNEAFHKNHTYYQEIEPHWLSMTGEYYRAIQKATFRDELEGKWGKQLFKIAELRQTTYSDEVAEDILKENRLVAEYQELFGKAGVTFQGSKLSFSSLAPYLASQDRKVRKEAFEAKSNFLMMHAADFDRILDELVKTRNQIAITLGYSSFVKLGYDRMHKTGHTPEDLVQYRKQVKEYGVPFISKLKKKQENRIGVSKLKYYDERYSFPTGTPKPKGSPKEILEIYRSISHELSPETGAFFEDLMEKRNVEVESRTNKMGGAFALYKGAEISPFVFANFNGTSNDVRVLAHEAGHAFQFQMSRHWNIHEYILPYDSAEVFSFAMERFIWPWVDRFFEEDAEKYQFSHLTEAFIYMPFVSVVDEFEHFLYDYPSATIQERKQKWRELEFQYMPERDYDDNEFLKQGTGFYEIAHLFMWPFYYMDYDLAHFAAVQLWIKQMEDSKSAWNSFIKMCEQGGSVPYHELLKSADLETPFEDNSVHRLLDKVQLWIDQVDDRSF